MPEAKNNSPATAWTTRPPSRSSRGLASTPGTGGRAAVVGEHAHIGEVVTRTELRVQLARAEEFAATLAARLSPAG
ncbi:hypothetical protein L6E12_31205 [Actinokineospora sp. PR83]|uniref:hypothetical protein n=1 Tax=Actinokineospora sp. PR83 TaxID=2884908 RepID=UPI001F2A1E8E|nr:hypothetical protein [Actinokineospora sp. PR83]MCG8920247.1 hypothetical protein [Actinokineospora sp. PR83]